MPCTLSRKLNRTAVDLIRASRVAGPERTTLDCRVKPGNDEQGVVRPSQLFQMRLPWERVERGGGAGVRCCARAAGSARHRSRPGRAGSAGGAFHGALHAGHLPGEAQAHRRPLPLHPVMETRQGIHIPFSLPSLACDHQGQGWNRADSLVGRQCLPRLFS